MPSISLQSSPTMLWSHSFCLRTANMQKVYSPKTEGQGKSRTHSIYKKQNTQTWKHQNRLGCRSCRNIGQRRGGHTRQSGDRKPIKKDRRLPVSNIMQIGCYSFAGMDHDPLISSVPLVLCKISFHSHSFCPYLFGERIVARGARW